MQQFDTAPPRVGKMAGTMPEKMPKKAPPKRGAKGKAPKSILARVRDADRDGQ